MTQPNMPATPQQLQDPLIVLHLELQQERDRLRRYAKDKLAPDDPRQQVYTELDGTVLSFMADISEKLIYTRDWLYAQLQEEIGQLEERIEAVEEPETQFTTKDASDFSDLCDGAELLAKESTWKDKKKKEDFIALIAKCRQTIDDNVMTDDEEEDEEEDAEEPPVIGATPDEVQS
jgi:hypothetical protein